MKIKATRIQINSVVNSERWYFGAERKRFWAENVGGDFPWKIVQEGDDLRTPLYVHKADARVERESWINVNIVQVISEC